MYPERMLDTPEKRNRFWNLRLGTMTALFPALAAGMIWSNEGVGIVVGIIVWILCVLGILRYNVFGRLMSQLEWLGEDD